MKNLFLYILIGLSFPASAQMNDNVWVIGYRYAGNGSPVPILDFTYGYPDTAAVFGPIDMLGTNAGICDSSGLLQFYTNGVSVVNKYNQVLPGSFNFNYDSIMYLLGYPDYFPLDQCAIVVPFPLHPDQYYIFHVSGNYNGAYTTIQPFRLAYSVVDMAANGGQGQMTQNNQEVFADTLLYSTLQAVKHANGRDWWVVIHEYHSNAFYASLLTPGGISQTVKSFAGVQINEGISGQSTFSPDGNKYAIAYSENNQVLLYSFDRCSGIFSADTIIQHTVSATGDNFSGCSFSPNSRYLYANDYHNLYQYDTYMIDIASSEKLIAVNDGYGDPFPTLFNKHCLGPDHKIYVNTGNGCQHLHVINQPDQPDTNCNFVQHQQKVIDYQSSLPVFPNYRLGAIQGSICDTILAVTNLPPGQLRVEIYPNPAQSHFTVELNSFAPANRCSVEIYNLVGEKVYSGAIYQKATVIGSSGLNPGLYFIRIKINGDSCIKKLLVE